MKVKEFIEKLKKVDGELNMFFLELSQDNENILKETVPDDGYLIDYVVVHCKRENQE